MQVLSGSSSGWSVKENSVRRLQLDSQTGLGSGLVSQTELGLGLVSQTELNRTHQNSTELSSVLVSQTGLGRFRLTNQTELGRRSWVRFPPRSKEFFLYLVWFPDSLY